MYDPRIGRWMMVDPKAGALPSSSPYAYANNNPVILIDPDGELPILPLLLKAGAAGASDMLLQVAMNYYFDEDVETMGQAFEKVDWWQVSRSAAEGLIPWKVPGGKLGKAAATAAGDVLTNAIKAKAGGGDYSKNDAVKDFTAGFLGDLAGGEIGDLVNKYGAKKIRTVFKKLGLADPCGCFTAGTQVMTANGNKNIEDIQVGDLVWAFDDETEDKALKEVKRTFTKVRGHIYKIHFGDYVIEATEDHPFFIGGKWIEVKDLQKGDALRLYDGREVSIDKIVYLKGSYEVFNFEVEDYHTYYVSDAEVLVHNSGPCDWTPKRMPKTGGTWSGKRGNSKWFSDKQAVNNVTQGEGVGFVGGYPDFRKWSKGEMIFNNLDGTDADFDKVYVKLAKMKGLPNKTAAKKYLKDKGLTPHHHQDGKTIQFIPTELHKNVPHSGGASNLRNGRVDD